MQCPPRVFALSILAFSLGWGLLFESDRCSQETSRMLSRWGDTLRSGTGYARLILSVTDAEEQNFFP